MLPAIPTALSICFSLRRRSFAAVTATSYTIQAVATGPQTKDTAACLTFSVDDQGTRLPADSTGCWR